MYLKIIILIIMLLFELLLLKKHRLGNISLHARITCGMFIEIILK